MGARDFKISITWQVGNTAAVSSGISQVNSALTGINGAANTAAGGMSTFGGSVQGTLPAIKGQSDAAQKAVGAHSAMAGAVGKSSNALSGFGTSVTGASQTLPGLTSAQQGASASNADLAAKTSKTTASMVSMGSRIGGMAFLFGGLTAAMGESAGTQEALEVQQKKLNEAQSEAREVIAKYGEGSVQAAEALKNVEDAERSVAFAGRIARLSYQDQLFFLLVLASQGIEPAIKAYGFLRQAQVAAAAAGVPLLTQLRNQGGILGRLVGGFTSLGGAIGLSTNSATKLAPAMSNVGITTTSARNASTGLSGALAGVGRNLDTNTKNASGARGAFSRLTGAFGGTTGSMAAGIGIMIGVGAALAVISTNTFGSRTALDQFGASVGKAAPGLGVLFEGIRDVAEAMGIVEDNGRSATDAFHELNEQITKNADSLKTGGDAWAALIEQLKQVPVAGDIIRFFEDIGRQWADTINILKQNPILGPIISGLEQASGQIQQWFNDNLVKPIQDFSKAMDEGFASGKSIIDSFAGAFGGASEEVKAASDKMTKEGIDPIVARGEAIVQTSKVMRENLTRVFDGFLEKMPFVLLNATNAKDTFADLPGPLRLSSAELKIMQLVLDEMGKTQGDTNAKVAAGRAVIQRLGTASGGTAGEVKKVSNAMTSLSDTLDKNAQDLAAYAQAMQEGTFQTKTHRQGMQEAELGLVKLAAEFSNTTGQVRFYTQENALAVRMALEFKLGVEEAKLELINQAAELARAAGAMQTYAQALRDGTIAENGYKQGIIDASQALIDRVAALAESRAAFELNNQLIEQAGLLALAFAEGEQEMKTSIQETTQELANHAGQLAALSEESNFASAAMNSLVQGFLDQEQTLADLALSYFEAVGKIESLKQSMMDIDQQMALLAVGFQQGRAEAFEWANGLAMAAGESMGLHSALQEVASGLDTEVVPAFRSSTEQLQTFISAIAGVPEAVASVTEGIDGMARNIVDTLRKAGEDGKDAFSENLDKMEEELGVRFSDPVVQKIEFEADLAQAQEGLQRQLEGIAAAMKPVDLGDKVTFDTAAIEASIQDAIRFIDSLPASIQPSVAATRETLASLGQIDFDTASFDEIVGAMASIVAESENLGSSVPGMLQELAKMPQFAQQGVEGFKALDKALANTGFSVTSAGDIIEDATGRIVTNIKDMPTQAQDPLTQLGNAILGTGQAATDARNLWAQQMVAMQNVITAFVLDSITKLANWNVAWTHNITIIAQTLGTLSIALAVFSTRVMPTWHDQILTVLDTNLKLWQTWAVNTGGAILLFGQSLNLFATEFMPKWADDINVNGLLPTTLHFETFVLTAGQYILEFSTALNIFAVQFMTTWANDVERNVLLAADGFRLFTTQAGQQIIVLSGAMNTFATNFMSAFASDVATNLEGAVVGFANFRSQAGSEIQGLAQVLNTFASSFMSAFAADIGTHLRSASSHVKSFASSFASAMSSVKSQASSATSAVKSLKSAIDSLQSKTITITVRYRTVGRPGLQKGGSFVVDRPTMVGGKQIGEFSKPELVTVTPLSNPNDIRDKSVTMDTGSVKRAVREDTRSGSNDQKGSLKKEVLEPIFVTIDGEVIMKLVQKRLLEFAADNII